MSVVPIPGTEGYAEQAAALVAAYEVVAFVDKHHAVLHMLLTRPGRVPGRVGPGSRADVIQVIRGDACSAMPAAQRAGRLDRGRDGRSRRTDNSLPASTRRGDAASASI